MAKFTTVEDLFDYVRDRQSVKITSGIPTSIANGGTPELSVETPEQGHQIVFNNPYKEGKASGEVVQDYDGRIKLGTFTLNDRGDWPDVNYNPTTLSPYLSGDKLTVPTSIVNGNDGELLYKVDKTDSTHAAYSPTWLFSIDALPFVIDSGNQDEIIHLDRYYDKKINPREYNLATEGKIKFYIYPRVEGRRRNTHYPFIERDVFTGADPETQRGGTNRFNVYSKSGPNAEGEGGYYLFKLNWGDGTTLEHTTSPLLLESSTLLEHTYEKPGFYKIMMVVAPSNKYGNLTGDFHFYKQHGEVAYKMKEGDTYLSVSKKFGVPYSRILKAADKKKAKPGRRLRFKANIFSHKQGWATGPLVKDACGKVIRDPRKSCRNYGYNYSKYCCSFCVKNRGINVGNSHTNIFKNRLKVI